jgi:hypothetical protein
MISTTKQITDGLAHVPIIGIDIWEHAFYLQYKNVKPDVSFRLLPVAEGQADNIVPQGYLGGCQLRRGREAIAGCPVD